MTFEERISGVERLRRIWFGEDRAESRLDRVLECADSPIAFGSYSSEVTRWRDTANHGSPKTSTCSSSGLRLTRAGCVEPSSLSASGTSRKPRWSSCVPRRVFMLGRKPSRIDILTSIDGVSFMQAWKSRVEADFVDTPLFCHRPSDALKTKRAAGRCQGSCGRCDA